jgi:hypothetical protein
VKKVYDYEKIQFIMHSCTILRYDEQDTVEKNMFPFENRKHALPSERTIILR